MFGGSAIFLSAQKGTVRRCNFNDNNVKIFNNFGTDSKNVKTLLNQATFTFSDCSFNVSQNTENAIFYFGEIGGSSYELHNCNFEGNLNKDAYYIEGELSSKNSPKLIVKSCKFESNSKKAFKSMDKNEFISINLKDQVFTNYENVKRNKFSWILTLTTVCAVIAITMIIIIVIKKKKNYSDDYQDGNEMSNEAKDISEASLTTPLI